MLKQQIVRLRLFAVLLLLLLLPLASAPAVPTLAGEFADARSPRSPDKTGPDKTGQEALASVGSNQGAFLLISDIHFDPFADASLVSRLAAAPASAWEAIFQSSSNHALSQDSRDSSYWLLASAIAAAQGSGVHYDYVLMTGDYLAHDFRSEYRAHHLADGDFQSFTIKTMVFVSRILQSAFPKAPVFGAIGNNDSTCDDYAEPPNGALFSTLASEWSAVAARPGAAKDVAAGGFYAVPHPTVPNQELIVLNSTFWSTHYHAGCTPPAHESDASQDPGTLEMKWLTRKLQETQRAGKTAVLVMHIPPGVDAFNSGTQNDCARITSFWKPEYVDAFLATTKHYRDILRDSYAAHLHRDDFRIVTDGGTPFLQVHLAPSISPIYLNNPAFEIGVYDRKNGALADYTVVYLKNYAQAGATESPDWAKEYAFRQAYNASRLSPASVSAVAAAIRTQPAIRAEFFDFFSAHNAVASIVSSKDWPLYSCAQTQIRASDFAACACPSPAAK